MRNAYQYLDHDNSYIDPETGVMRNKVGIDDDRLLMAFEGLKVSARLEELCTKPIRIESSETLLDIHRHLFQDVYDWAGKVRTVEISKSGTQFFSLGYFHRAFPFIDSLIAQYRRIGSDDKPALAYKLAEILDTVNYLHPFREGNGRTQREFLRLMALERGIELNLNPPDNADIYERYMAGTVNGDVKLLSELILDII
jgi:cell filamentation protein